MSEFDTIIPIGQSCLISFLLQNCHLKKETSLFEWWHTIHLNKITNIIRKIANNIDINAQSFGELILLEDKGMYTGHYRLEEFGPICKRRSERFVKSLQTDKKILFVRYEFNNSELLSGDIDDFFASVKLINPDINAKLLLITPIEIGFSNPLLINRVNRDGAEDRRGERPELNRFFVELLKEIGVDTTNTIEHSFTDKSEI